MKNGQAATLSATLLFRKGTAMPTDIVNGYAGRAIASTIELAPKPQRQLDPNAAVRVSVQLDRARRQHLQLAAAKLGVSNQKLLLDALDHYLRSEVPVRVGERCACLKDPGKPEPA